MAEVVAVEKIYVELGSIREELLAVRRQLAQFIESNQRQESTEHPHIVRSPKMHRGEPAIRGSSITVRTIVERTRLGEAPERILEALPSLSLAQVHDALGYYYDHPGEIESSIRENQEALWQMNRKNASS